MKQFKWLILVVVIVCALAIVLSNPRDNSFSLSDFSFLPQYDSSTVVMHKYYSLSYNEEHEQAEWVAYSIKPENSDSEFKRRNIFRRDTLVETETASDKDYYKSGFDRGHLVPAGDMTFDSIALEESFYYSNISPQLAGFNRGVWKSLENQVRKLGSSNDSLIVFTGPVFMGGADRIGENDVSVPDYFYKIIIKFNANRISSSSYLIPHKEGLSGYEEYQVSIDSIEIVSGLDFLSDLPDKLESKLERHR